MKKLYFFVLTFFAGLSLNAQILTQGNNAPAIGDMFRTTDVSTVGVTSGAAGNGVTWDMSAVSIGTAITINTVVPVPSASTAAFPSASVAVQNSVTSNYLFYSSSGTDLKLWGGSVTAGTVNVNLNYSSAAVLANYAMAYNSTASNTIAGTFYVPAFSISGTFNGTCSINADGLGTLALPTRTFTNVLRKKVTQELNLSVSPFGSGTATLVTYEYFAPGLDKSSLFTIMTSDAIIPLLGTSSQTLVTVNSDYQYVGISENTNEITSLNIFPNPASNNFTLAFMNENAENVSVEIVNALGQLVKKEILENTKGLVKQNVNITGIEAGVYFVKTNVGSKSSVKKLTIQ